MPGNIADFPQQGSYGGYFALAGSGREEPMSTHSDHYMTNFAYGRAAYSKGATFLSQLRYVIGEENVAKGLHTYYNTWKFKHPNPNDFIRVMEKESGLELDWFKEYFFQSTDNPDYAIESVSSEGKKKTKIKLEKVGRMPMPIDVVVTYADDEKELFHIPLVIMRGEKKQEFSDMKFTVLNDWAWVNPDFEFEKFRQSLF